ncbi:MAG: P-type conjugative transfer protein TrbJ [Hyphomonadaceae bacterium]|nr:P-type conjugative transfer protein TrbJ [Hyphomonadaceae bacterium]
MQSKLLRTACAFLMTLSLAIAPAPKANAITVIDPSNLAQNILQVSHMVEQLHNQVQQIEQAAAMLRQNPLQLSPELSQSINEARSLFQSVQGLAFQAHQLGDDLRALYPETWDEFDLDQVLSQSNRWMSESRQSLQRAMQAEASAAERIEQTRGHIDRALQSSRGAEGQTGAIQASNQLLGIQATQLAEIHALLIVQGRALETERMERLAREDRALEIQRRAFPTQRVDVSSPSRTAFEN